MLFVFSFWSSLGFRFFLLLQCSLSWTMGQLFSFLFTVQSFVVPHWSMFCVFLFSPVFLGGCVLGAVVVLFFLAQLCFLCFSSWSSCCFFSVSYLSSCFCALHIGPVLFRQGRNMC